MKKLILITFLSLFLFNCNSDDSPSNVDPNVFPQEMSISTILDHSSNRKFENFANQKLIIQNENDWNTFKTTLNEESGLDGANFTEVYFSETEIDFSQFQVVAIFDIIRPYYAASSSGLFVNSVQEFEDSIKVNYKIVYVQTFSTFAWQGYRIIKIPKSDKEIVFVQQQ
jgi:hypothetical protein